jgi:alpha-tubulin suppressor-like RCC1 family protein
MPSCIQNNDNLLANVVINSANTGYNFNSIQTREIGGLFVCNFNILCNCKIRLNIGGNATADLVTIRINNSISQSFFLYQIYDDYIDVNQGDLIQIEMSLDRYQNPNYIFGFINVENRPSSAYCIDHKFTDRGNGIVSYTSTGYIVVNQSIYPAPWNQVQNLFDCYFTAACNNTVINLRVINSSQSYKAYFRKDYDAPVEILSNTTLDINVSRNYNQSFWVESEVYNGSLLLEATIRVEVSVVSASYPSATPTPTVTQPTPTPTSTPTPTPIPSSTYCGLIAECVSPYSAVPPSGFQITGLCAGDDGYYFINNSTEGHIYFEVKCDGDLIVEINNSNLYNTVYAIVDGTAAYIKKANPYSATIPVTANDSVKIQYLPSNYAWNNGEITGKVYFILPTPTPSLPFSTAATPTPTPSQTSNSSCSCMAATTYYGTISNGTSACELNFKPTNVISSTYEDYYYFEFLCDGYVEISYLALQKFKYSILKNNTSIHEVFTNKQNQSGYKLVPVSAGDTILIKLYASGFVFKENDFFGTIRYIENQPTPTPTPSPTQYCGITINDQYLAASHATYTSPCSYLFNLKSNSCIINVEVVINGYLTVNYDSKKTGWYFYKRFFNNNILIDISSDENIKGTLCIPVLAGEDFYLVITGQQGSGIFSSLDVTFSWSEYSATPTPSPSATFFGSTPTPTPTPIYNLISYGYNKDAQCGLGYASDNLTNYSIQNATLFASSSIPWFILGKNRTSASAIKEDGKAFVWGSNAYNKLGTNTLPADPYLSPTAILEDKNIASIVDGYKTMYYLTTDGDLWGCGDNSYGAFGNNNTTSVTSPVFLTGNKSNPWIKIDAGVDFAAGIKADGTLWTWGKNTNGNLGDNTVTHRSSPVQIVKSPGIWVDLSCGDNHIVAKWRSPTFKYYFYSWGSNTSGQLGDNTSFTRSSPVIVRADLNWSNFSCGTNFTYALNNTGNWPYSYTGYSGYNYLHSWGNNADKKIHQKMDLPSNFDSVLLPVQVNQLNTWTGKYDEPYVNATFVSSSENNAAVLDVFGKEIVFGKNEYYVTNPNRSFNYQLSDLSLGNGFLIGIPKNYDPPLSTPAATLPCLQLLEKSNIDVTSYTDAEGTGFKWSISETNYGDNYVRFLINCPNVNVYTFGKVKFAGITGNVKNIYNECSSGNNLGSFKYENNFIYVSKYGINSIIEFSLEYDADEIEVGAAEGIIKIVSDASEPTLTPDTSATPTPTPTESPIPTPFPTVEGALALWGDNQYGQLGLGNKDNKSIPTQIGTEKNWNAGDGGNGFTIAFKSDNKIYSWGKNDLGQLGKGDKDYISSPIQMQGSNKWISVGAGGNIANAIEKQPPTQTPTLTPTPTPTSTPCASLLPLSLYMWGNNYHGQLGRNTKNANYIYNDYGSVLGNSVGWKDVAMGTGFTLAVKYDGTLWGWGLNSQYQLGDGTGASRSSPVQTKALGNNWLNVSAGIINAVAVKQDGSMWAWGGKTINKCVTSYNVNSPVEVCGNTKSWAQAYAGNDFVLARKLDNSLWGWGANNYGQLGNNDADLYIVTPIQIGLSASDWSQISTSYWTSGGIKSDGSLYMWGLNTSGELGTGDFANKSNPTQTVAGGTDWKFVSCGINRTFAIKTNGTIWTWGRLSQYAILNSPIQVANQTSGWSYIDAGTATAIKDDGSLWRLYSSDTYLLSPSGIEAPCGGKWFKVVSDSNNYWSIAFLNGPTPTPMPTDPTPTPTPTNTPSPTPSPTTSPTWTPAPSLNLVSGILSRVNTTQKIWNNVDYGFIYSTFHGHQYEFHAIRQDYSLYKFTSSSDSNYFASNKVTDTYDWDKVYDDTFFYSYNIGIKKDGTMWAWGRNNINDATWGTSSCDEPNGVLGTGDKISQKYPVQTGLNTSDWTKASLGPSHAAAIKNNGTLWTWGSNCYGQLGDGTYTHRSQPVQEAHNYTDWIDVCCMYHSTFGLRSDGSVWIWGREFGLLLGNRQSDMAARSKITINGWKQVVCTNNSLLLLHRNGTVWWNDQLILPVVQQIQYLNNIKEIRAAWQKYYALTESGDLYVWGENRFLISNNPPLYGGLLGDGTIQDRTYPVQVLPNDGFYSIGIKIPPTPTPTVTTTPVPSGTGATPTPTPTAEPPTCVRVYRGEKSSNYFLNYLFRNRSFYYYVYPLVKKGEPSVAVDAGSSFIDIFCDGYYKISLYTNFDYNSLPAKQQSPNNDIILRVNSKNSVSGSAAIGLNQYNPVLFMYLYKGDSLFTMTRDRSKITGVNLFGVVPDYYVICAFENDLIIAFEFITDNLLIAKRLRYNKVDGYLYDYTGDLRVNGSFYPQYKALYSQSKIDFVINRRQDATGSYNCRSLYYQSKDNQDPLDFNTNDFKTGVYTRSFAFKIKKRSRIKISIVFNCVKNNGEYVGRIFRINANNEYSIVGYIDENKLKYTYDDFAFEDNIFVIAFNDNCQSCVGMNGNIELVTLDFENLII